MKVLRSTIQFFTLTSLVSVGLSAQVVAQCRAKANGQMNSISITCGQKVDLSAIGIDGNFIVNRDFNDGTVGEDWEADASGQFDNPCPPSADGSTYLWFGPSSDVPRELETFAYDVSTGAKITFDMKYAREPDGAPCEGPDLPGEGVYLQYSTDGGGSWVTIFYWDPYDGDQNPNTPGIPPPTGNGQIDSLTNWKTRTFDIPAAARTTNTKFRWYQDAGSGAEADHWGLDNIKIEIPGLPWYFVWQHTGLISKTTPSVYPGTTTTYTVLNTNGVDSCYASVTVNVINNNTITSRAARYSICPGDTTLMLTESNMFAPNPSTCGLGPNYSGCPTGYTDMGIKQVGTGTIVNAYNNAGNVDIFGDFGQDACAVTQIIFRAAELTAAGLSAGYIKSVAFDVANADEDAAGAYQNLSIAVGCTNTNSFTTSNSQVGLPVATVYNPRTRVISAGWNTFEFDRAYSWDGVSNVVVQVCWYGPDGETGNWSSKTRNHNPGFTAMIQTNSNFSNANCIVEFPTDNESSRPNTRFGFCKSTPSSNIKFEWTPTAGLTNPSIYNPIASPNATTVYTVKIYDQTYPQCGVTDTAKVIIKPFAIPVISGAATYCQTSQVSLAATSTAGSTFAWTRNGTAIAGGAALTDGPLAPGSYRYIVQATLGGCPGGKDTIDVLINPNPAVPAITPPLVCASQPATYSLSNGASYGSGTEFTWTGPSFSQVTTVPSVTRNPSIAGAYTVQAKTLATGCVSTVTNFTISTNPIPALPSITTNASNLCPGGALLLNGTTEVPLATTYATNGNTRSATRYTYDYNAPTGWTGPGIITNANTKNASVAAIGAGIYTYSFSYNRTTERRDTTCTRNPLNGTCVGTPTIVITSVTCPSNVVSKTDTVVALPTATKVVQCVDGPDADSDPNDQFVVTITAHGGKKPYTVDGNVLADSVYVVPAQNNGAYSHNVRDSRNCAPVTVSGSRDCTVSCTAVAANFTGSTATKKVCGVTAADKATFSYRLVDEDADPLNMTKFYIHDGTFPASRTGVLDSVAAASSYSVVYNGAKMTKGATYYITAARAAKIGSNVDFADQCIQYSNTMSFLFYDLPQVSITALPGQLCLGGVDTLLFTATGIGPFDIDYNDGTTIVNLTGKASGYKEFVTPANTTDYTVTKIVDKGTGSAACSTTDNSATGLGTTNVTIVGSPTAGTPLYKCNAAQDGYQVRFPVTPDPAATPIVKDTNGVVVGHIDDFGAVDTFYYDNYVTSGDSFRFVLSDINSCNPVTVSNYFTCVCKTNAGSMKSTTVDLCAGQTTSDTLHVSGSEVLDANDALLYILHEGYRLDGTLRSPLDTSDKTVFGFDPTTMQLNKSYYISAVAANKKGTGIDTNDNCKNVTLTASEVIWRSGPNATIFTDDTICVGEQAELTFSVTGGASPYDLVYNDGSTNHTLNGIGNTYIETLSGLTGSNVYKLVSVTDGNCPGIVSTTPAEVVVIQYDVATITYSENVYCKDGGEQPVANLANSTKPGSFTYHQSGTDISQGLTFLNQSTGQIDVANTQIGRYYIIYTTLGRCPSIDSTQIEVIKPLVKPTVTYPDDQRYCRTELQQSPTVDSLGGNYVIISSSPSSAKLSLPNKRQGIIRPQQSDAGVYEIEYTISDPNGTGCAPKSDTTTVTILSNPIADFSIDDDTLCVNEKTGIHFTGVYRNLSTTTFSWSHGTGFTDSLRKPTQPVQNIGWKLPNNTTGIPISLTLNEDGCPSNTVTRRVWVYPRPIADFDISELPPVTYHIAEKHPFFFYEQASNDNSWLWEFRDGTTSDEPQPEHIFQLADTFYVTLTVGNEGGSRCVSEITKGPFIIIDGGNIKVPTGFTPNGDTFNDSFKPSYDRIHDMTYTIYSRWGDLMYTGDLNDNGWDGKIRGGALAPDGVYVYVVNGHYYDGTIAGPFTGVVTLYR